MDVLKAMRIVCALFTFVFVAAQAHAFEGEWRRIVIPGAVCGNGKPYPVFVRSGDPSRLTLDFQGGGMCWNAFFCHGPIPLASVKARKKPVGLKAILSDNMARSPLAGDSVVYFPYCTGDVFAGDHVASYPPGPDVHHRGRSNISKALDYLSETGVMRTEGLERVTVYGDSAGAIGSAIHMEDINARFGHVPKKTQILDAPGLHYPEYFWVRFPNAILADIGAAFNNIGVDFSLKEGILGDQAPDYCARFSDWTIGVLQGTRDFTMSVVFAQTSPFAHERWVMGPRGIVAGTEAPANCSSWAPRTMVHTFLTRVPTSRMRVGGQSAMDYARLLLEGGVIPNFN